MDNQNISFTGILYCIKGNHLTKGIVCCPHGDRKFVKFVNKIAKEKPDELRISTDSDGLTKILVTTKEYPQLSFAEKILMRVDKLQQKALKEREQGKISGFIYKLNKLEYQNLRRNYPFISSKTLDKFEENIKKLAPKEVKDFINQFFT